MTRYTPKTAEKKRNRAMLPLIGFLFAFLLAVLAYLAAPTVVDIAKEQSSDIARQFNELEADYGETNFNALVAFLMWLVMLALSAFVVAVFVGRDPEVASFRELPPSPANRKQHKRDLKRRLRQVEQQQKKLKK